MLSICRDVYEGRTSRATAARRSEIVLLLIGVAMGAGLVGTGCGPGINPSAGTGGGPLGGTETGGVAAPGTGGAQTGGVTATGGTRGTGGVTSPLGTGGRFWNFGGTPFGGPGSGGVASGGAPTGGVASGGAPTGGSTGGAGGSGGASASGLGPMAAFLPAAKEACPTIASGNLTFLGQPVTIWAGAAPSVGPGGPVVIYWYATGSNPQEAVRGLGQAAINEIVAQGGLVAAPGATNKKGTNTGNGVWYTGDFETTDEVIACAIQQLHVDTSRIHAAGFSAGGLQTTRMSYDRSGYLASIVTYSGGLTGLGGTTSQDATNVPGAMVVHGAQGSDVVIIDFAQASASYEADLKKRGGFAIDCNHGGGHMIPTGIAPSTWTFMKTHPFHVSPEPYAAGIPASFPSYCTLP